MSLRDFAALILGLLAVYGLTENALCQDPLPAPPIESLDRSTTPFEFRSSDFLFPVLESNSDCQLTVSIRGFDQASDKTLSCSFRLVRVRDGEIVAREQTRCQLDANGDSEPIALLDQAPSDAGVYEVRCRLFESNDPLWTRFQRKEKDLASSAFPIVVTNPDATANELMNRRPVWTVPTPVNEMDPDTWQALQWVPGNPSRLMPNMRRVGETIAKSTWRSSTNSNERVATLGPSGTFLGSLPKQETHQLHELFLEVEQARSSLSVAKLLVQFSREPDFDSIEQEVECSISRNLDLSAGGVAECSPLRVLYIPASEQMFCRIVNQESDQSLQVRSIGFRKLRFASQQPASDSEDSDKAWPDAHQIILRARADDWISKLTRDLDSLERRQVYAPSTMRLHRFSVAVDRLADYAVWFGCSGFDLFVGTPQSERGWESWMVDQTGVKLQSDVISLRQDDSLRNGSSRAGSLDDGLHCRIEGVNAELQFTQTLLKLANSSNRLPGKGVLLDYASLPLATPMDLSSALTQVKLAREWNDVRSGHEHQDDPTRGTLRVLGATDSMKSGNLLFLNASPWRQQMELTFGEALSDCVVHEFSGHPDLDLHHDDKRCLLQLPAGSISCVKLTFQNEINDEVPVVAWKGTMANPQPTIALCKSVIGEVISSTGTLELPNTVYPHLRNGGFESDGQVGIVGWMQTQFPSDAVVLDLNEAIEGARSIRMTNSEKSSGRTWIVSETIPVPKTSRLAVSLSVRAAKAPPESNDATPHRIRVSFEGEREGVPVQIVSELDVDRNGQWQARRLVLEAEATDLRSLETIRLTIDSISSGTIWIDDVQLHDEYATEEERNQIHGQAYLAVQGIRRGNLASVTRLLSNDWTRQLLIHSDLLLAEPSAVPPTNVVDSESQARPPWTAGTIERRSQPAEIPGIVPDPATELETKDPADPPSVAERIRGWLPRPIRF